MYATSHSVVVVVIHIEVVLIVGRGAGSAVSVVVNVRVVGVNSEVVVRVAIVGDKGTAFRVASELNSIRVELVDRGQE